MSTPNYKQAVSVLFVYDNAEEQHEWDYALDAVKEEVAAKFKGAVADQTVCDDNRSYYTTAFMAYTAGKRTRDRQEALLTAYFTVCSGYYGGASFDVYFRLEVNGEPVEIDHDVERCENSVPCSDCADVERYGGRIVPLLEWARDERARIIKRARGAYKAAGLVEIRRVAVFSNGEAVYEKV